MRLRSLWLLTNQRVLTRHLKVHQHVRTHLDNVKWLILSPFLIDNMFSSDYIINHPRDCLGLSTRNYEYLYNNACTTDGKEHWSWQTWECGCGIQTIVWCLLRKSTVSANVLLSWISLLSTRLRLLPWSALWNPSIAFNLCRKAQGKTQIERSSKKSIKSRRVISRARADNLLANLFSANLKWNKYDLITLLPLIKFFKIQQGALFE